MLFVQYVRVLCVLCSSSLKSTAGSRDSGEKLRRGLAEVLVTTTTVDAPTGDTKGGTEESMQGARESGV